MKKKYISKTYLRGVIDYDIKIIKDDEFSCYTSVKYIKEIELPYISTHTGTNRCLMDKNYYIVEYIPIKENYVVRVFMNEKKEIIQYYIDIIKESGIEDNIPFYYDLYLDITIDLLEERIIKTWDENELIEALEKNIITRQDYILAQNTLNDILIQIKNNKNQYINRDHKKVVDKLINKY